MMPTILCAGAAYFAVVFAIGFALGTLRVLWTAPALGETLAVLAELPVMLAASWIVAGRVLRAYGLRGPGPALVMGAVAFGLLMASEFLLARLAFGQSAQAWLASQLVIPGVFGLAGQLAFAVVPALRAAIARQPRG